MAVGLITAIVGAFLVVTAGVAGAHHPEVIQGGSSVCTPTSIEVTVTVQSWIVRDDPTSDGRDINDNVLVWYSTQAEAGPYTAVPPGGYVDHDDTFSRTFNVPLDTEQIWVVAEAQVPWGNDTPARDVIIGASPNGTWNPAAADPTQLGLVDPGDCAGEPEPTATASYTCDDGNVVVTLSNTADPGDQSAIFDVSWDGLNPGSTQVTVAADDSDQVLVPIAENESLTVIVNSSSGSGFNGSFPLTRDCQSPPGPSAQVSYQCDASEVSVTLINSGDEAAVFFVDWDGNGDPIEVTVPGNSSVPFGGIGIAENETITVEITSPSGAGYADSFTVERDCLTPPEPSALVSYECANDEVSVTLVNTGQEAATFDISWTGDNPGSDTVTVAGNDSVPYTGIGIVENEALTVTITSTSGLGYSESFPIVRNCDEPVPFAEVSYTCDDAEVTVVLINNGDDTAEFLVDWTGNADPVAASVGPFTSEPFTGIGIAENETIVVDITSASGSEFDGTFSVERDCQSAPDPSAVATYTCDESVVRVTLTNDGDEAAVFFVDWDGNGDPIEVTVGGNASVNLPGIPIDENESILVSITSSSGSGFQQDFFLTRDCQSPPDPSAEVSYACDEDEVTVTLTNDGDEDAVFLVDWTGNGDPVEVTVAGNDSEPFTGIGIDENETLTVTISSSSGAGYSESFEVERDCQSPPDPSADVFYECDEDEVTVTLSNDGDEDAVFLVDWTGNPGAPVEVTVPGTSSQDFPGIAIAEDETITVVITSDSGVVPFSQTTTVTRDCRDPQPVATISVECVDRDGLATVLLQNNGDQAVDLFSFEVTGPGGYLESGSVADLGPGESQSFTLANLVDGPYTATAVADGDPVVVGGSPLTVDCDPIPAELGDYVWYDVDRDGVQDQGEPPVPGVEVVLWLVEPDCSIIEPFLTTVTNDDGLYLFEDLNPDLFYTLQFIPPDGVPFTLPNVGDDALDSDADPVTGILCPTTPAIDLDEGESNVSFDAGLIVLEPSIDIEKATNGEDADTITGPVVEVGTTVVWTYVITNDGEYDLTDITLVDDQGVLPVPSQDGEFNIGDIDQDDILDIGESWTYTAEGTAVEGQYENLATTTGNPLNPQGNPPTDPLGNPVPGVSDEDPSHYLAFVPGEADIDIEKLTNGEDADLVEDAVAVLEGQDIVWTYIVTNIGGFDLENVEVNDDMEDFICTIPFLAVGGQATCTLNGVAGDALYENVADTVGCPVDENGDRATNPDGSEIPCPTDDDPSHYVPAQVQGFAVECATGGVQISLSNSSDSTATLSVTKNGATIGVFQVPASSNGGGTFTALIPMEEGETADIGVFSGSVKVAGAKITRDCDPDPTPTTQVQGQVLARTGVDSGDMARTAGWLLVIGGLLMMLVRRREYELVTA